MELTRMVERLLYSPYRPTEQDVEKSRQLTRKIAGNTMTVTKGGSQE
jgi:hypothetical protein